MTKKAAKKEPHKHQPQATRVVDDSQSVSSEAQQQPGGSGDPRTDNAVGTPLPWGRPSDDLHPINQPAGNVEDPSNQPVGQPGKRTKSA